MEQCRCSLYSEDYEQDEGVLVLTSGHLCFEPLDKWVDLTDEPHITVRPPQPRITHEYA